jgi:hypothetical protein
VLSLNACIFVEFNTHATGRQLKTFKTVPFENQLSQRSDVTPPREVRPQRVERDATPIGLRLAARDREYERRTRDAAA